MTRILAVFGLALALIGCAGASMGDDNPAYNATGNTGVYDGPKGGHGGPFGG